MVYAILQFEINVLFCWTPIITKTFKTFHPLAVIDFCLGFYSHRCSHMHNDTTCNYTLKESLNRTCNYTRLSNKY